MKRKRYTNSDIMTETTFPNGYLVVFCYCRITGDKIKSIFIGYNKKEAIKEFKENHPRYTQD